MSFCIYCFQGHLHYNIKGQRGKYLLGYITKDGDNIKVTIFPVYFLFVRYASLNMSFPTEQSGQAQSSGNASNAVPAAIPLSGSPTAGS